MGRCFSKPVDVRGFAYSDVGCREHRSQLRQRGEHVGALVGTSSEPLHPPLPFPSNRPIPAKDYGNRNERNLRDVRGERFSFLEKAGQKHSRTCYSRDLTPKQVYWKEPYPPFTEQEFTAEMPDTELEHFEHQLY